MTASPTIWAIADLHLSFARPRDQTRYGDCWRDHTIRLQEAWQTHIAPQDVVLLPGDLSWGKNPLRAQPDIDWLAALPEAKCWCEATTTTGGATSLKYATPSCAPECMPCRGTVWR